MRCRYVTMNVFTGRIFSGNPLAVVLDGASLSDTQMQSIATEFGYAETTFILPPRNPGHTRQVRIFTPRIEVPFAGHPNIGTAVALGNDLLSQGEAVGDDFIFEEKAGPVPIRLFKFDGKVVAAELTAPQALTLGGTMSRKDAAACLSLSESEVEEGRHPPRQASIGLPFVIVELKSRDALRRAKPDFGAHERLLPPLGTDAIFAYVRGTDEGSLHARMFSPLDATYEDPATGSACGATIALLASLHPSQNEVLRWEIEQGVEMGRPSEISGRTEKTAGKVCAVHVGGHAVAVMQGHITIPE
ncbi:MAG TPA: PhzF family phenazine biosynthesis protein [Steroidobacteraceae bacterium]